MMHKPIFRYKLFRYLLFLLSIVLSISAAFLLYVLVPFESVEAGCEIDSNSSKKIPYETLLNDADVSGQIVTGWIRTLGKWKTRRLLLNKYNNTVLLNNECEVIIETSTHGWVDEYDGLYIVVSNSECKAAISRDEHIFKYVTVNKSDCLSVLDLCNKYLLYSSSDFEYPAFDSANTFVYVSNGIYSHESFKPVTLELKEKKVARNKDGRLTRQSYFIDEINGILKKYTPARSVFYKIKRAYHARAVRQ